MKTPEILVFGAGGHAKVVVDAVECHAQFKIVGIVANNLNAGERWLGYSVVEMNQFKASAKKGVIAVGDNHVRKQLAAQILELCPDFEFITVIHPKATLGRDVTIGVGSVVLAASVINAFSKIGMHCLLNTGSIVEHDCVIENFASVAPAATLGGGAKLGEGSAVSMGAVVLHRVEVGAQSVIGAGSTVVKNIPASVTAYGTPCKIVRPRKQGDKYL